MTSCGRAGPKAGQRHGERRRARRRRSRRRRCRCGRRRRPPRPGGRRRPAGRRRPRRSRCAGRCRGGRGSGRRSGCRWPSGRSDWSSDGVVGWTTRWPIPPVSGTPVMATAPKNAPVARMTRLSTMTARVSSARPSVGRRAGRRSATTTTTNRTSSQASPRPPPHRGPPHQDVLMTSPRKRAAGQQDVGQPGRARPAPPGVRRRRARAGVVRQRDERPEGEVDDDADAPQAGGDDEGHPDDGDVDLEPLGDPAAHAGDQALRAAAAQGRGLRRSPGAAPGARRGAVRSGSSSVTVIPALCARRSPSAIGDIPGSATGPAGTAQGCPPSPDRGPRARIGASHATAPSPPAAHRPRRPAAPGRTRRRRGRPRPAPPAAAVPPLRRRQHPGRRVRRPGRPAGGGDHARCAWSPWCPSSSAGSASSPTWGCGCSSPPPTRTSRSPPGWSPTGGSCRSCWPSPPPCSPSSS